MLDVYDRVALDRYLHYWGNVEPDDAFWKKAEQYGFRLTYNAIRKAYIEKQKETDIEYITSLIAKIVKEDDKFVYRNTMKGGFGND